MKTERLNLLIAPEDKAEIARRAAGLGLSSSELVRRAVAAYDPESDEAEMRALAQELGAGLEQAETALDRAIERLDGLESSLERIREQARRETFAAGEDWPFALPSRQEERPA